jgi:hypothetical protein
MKCQHCGHETPSEATRSVAVDHPARPVAAPCTISGCYYETAVRYKAALQRIMQVLGPDVPSNVDYTDLWNASGLVAEQMEALAVLRDAGIKYVPRKPRKFRRVISEGK